MQAILTGVSDFFSAIFSVDTTNPGMATQLITWLTTPANALALVGLYLYILSLKGSLREYKNTDELILSN